MSPTRTIAGEVGRVANAMEVLGGAYRGDWSEFDGRTLRFQLKTLADFLRRAERGESMVGPVAAFYAENNLCPTCRSWREHCDCAGSA